MLKKSLLLLPLLALLPLAGCNKPVALNGIKRVAVLTIENYTKCPSLGDEIKREILAQMPKGFIVEVIDGEPLERQMLPTAAEVVMSGRAAEIGRRYGVDAFVLGEATLYEEKHQEHLGLEFGKGKFDADVRVDLTATVGFNLRLVRAADGASLLYRQSSQTATEALSFGLNHPYISFTVSAQPIYPQLRAEAVHNAVGELLRELAKAKNW